MKPEIYIKDDSITIGQLLKKIGLIQTRLRRCKILFRK